MNKLRECPFCGSDTVELDHHINGWFVSCDKCPVSLGTDFPTKELALSVWNLRNDSKWISVNDELPKITYTDDSPCKINGREIPPAHKSDSVLVVYNGVVRIKCFEWLGNKLASEFTHWMPLPKGPSDE